MSPTSTPDAALSGHPSYTDYEKQPGVVTAAICVAFAFLISLLLYMLGWEKIRITRQPATPPVASPDHAQHQHTAGNLAQPRNRNVSDGPEMPKPATLAGRRLGSTAEVADATTCPVCLDDFAAGTAVGRLPCGHVFCSACIDHWLSGHSFTCPMCRFNLEAGSAHAKDLQQ
ncbi:RING/U-box [Colletotrichum zoysiae]|uniref:RING-type E3 ubiquitin transferase n=1 Tax=Colletotrichum zoysiae TaxID=1216348 RepID=A0AAD9H756_9PEZI|nr:RING/U-box [Colletotrichum zoysiae]